MQIKWVSARLGGLGSIISALRRKQSQVQRWRDGSVGKALASEAGELSWSLEMSSDVHTTVTQNGKVSLLFS